MQCHTSDTELFARQVQYQNSTHFLGGNFERSTASCAACHTHEGFMDRLATGAQAASGDIQNPTPVNCRTCHQIHTTYTDADYGLTSSAPVDLWTGGTVDFGNGNLCANCHQARPLSPSETPVVDGPDVTIGSIRYGYHHGPQAQVLAGTGGIAFSPIQEGPSMHGDAEDGCITCHMAEPFGNQAGGHTFAMSYLYHGAVEDLVAGCQTCHRRAEDFDYLGLQSTVQMKLDSLRTLLRTIGVVNANSDYRVPGTWPANVAAAALNFQMILEDRSLGLHNPPYIIDLLNQSLAEMEPLAAPVMVDRTQDH